MYNIVSKPLNWNSIDNGSKLVKHSFSEVIENKKVTLVCLIDIETNVTYVIEEHFEDIVFEK